MAKSCGVFVIAHATLSPNDVQVGAFPITMSDFAGATSSRIEPGVFLSRPKRGPMNGHIENLRVVKGQVLNSVPVVNIPVKDEDSTGAPRVASVFGSNSDVVKVAKSCESRESREG